MRSTAPTAPPTPPTPPRDADADAPDEVAADASTPVLPEAIPSPGVTAAELDAAGPPPPLSAAPTMEVAEAAPAVSTRPRLQCAAAPAYGPHRMTCPLRQETTPATTGYVRLPPSYEPGQACSATTPAGVQIQFLPPPSAQPGDIVPVPFPGSPPTQPAPQQAPRAPPRAPMTAEGAIAAAEAEGLTLLRAENTAGFKHVSVQNSNAIRPFRAQKDMGAARAHIGDFATAEEAALAVARFLRSSVTAASQPRQPAQPPMTAEEAIAAATAEGLALIPESSRGRKSTTGFYCVQHSNNHADRPFKAVPYVGGRQHYQGHFATAEEAALAVARFLGPERVAAALAAAPTGDQSRSRELPPRRQLPPEWTCVEHTSASGASTYKRYHGPGGKSAQSVAECWRIHTGVGLVPTMTAAEALAAAAAEGLALLRAENATGFMGVYRNGTVHQAVRGDLHRGGRNKYLGMFATAEEAALAVARALGPEEGRRRSGRRRRGRRQRRRRGWLRRSHRRRPRPQRPRPSRCSRPTSLARMRTTPALSTGR